MIKKPFVNGLLASAYIFALTYIMSLLESRFSNQPDNVLSPVLPLSMLTLSAAVMGYLFFVTPLELFLSNKKGEGVKYFLQTLGSFAVITLVILLITFLDLI